VAGIHHQGVVTSISNMIIISINNRNINFFSSGVKYGYQ